MDGDMMRGLEGLGEVWSRVTGGAEPGGGRDTAAEIREFIGDETRDAAFYAALACKARSASRTLYAMSADERRHGRDLKIEYYLLTGESYTPPQSCPLTESVPEALRAAYKAELAGAEAYETAAAATDCRALGELYLSNAADERRHAESIKCLISRLI